MTSPLTAPEILSREFLELRCKILDLAASFDRLTRAEGSLDGDPRLARLQQALEIVRAKSEDRAEQVQMLFSRQYDENWQSIFRIKQS